MPLVGSDPRKKLRQIGINGLISDPQLPFFIEWLTSDDLHPTKVTFEQTRQVPLPWRIGASGGAR